MKDITITITTCKRLDLFIKTMDSFLAMCQDQDRIERWIIGDDGSTEEDIQQMQTKYPFLEIHKSPKRGQAHNLNNIFNKVETSYIFHMEDDWEFILAGHFLRDGVEVIRNFPPHKIVVIRPVLGLSIQEGCGVRYMIRPDWKPGTRLGQPGQPHVPHYTLNPSIQLTKAVKSVMPFTQSGVEAVFAEKFTKKGYRMATLVDIYVEHRGEKVSAFTLNGTGR